MPGLSLRMLGALILGGLSAVSVVLAWVTWRARVDLARLSDRAAPDAEVWSQVVHSLANDLWALVLLAAAGVLALGLMAGAWLRASRRSRDRLHALAEALSPQGTSDSPAPGDLATPWQRLEAVPARLAAQDAARAEEAARLEHTAEMVAALRAGLAALQGGALDHRLPAAAWQDLGPEHAGLWRDFNALAESWHDTVAALRGSAHTVTRSAAELAGMSDEMARRAEVQAATLKQSAAALGTLSASVETAAGQAQDADEKMGFGRRHAEEGGAIMDRALEAMSSIARSSEKISRIITAIDDIAFQTNLLALNAGVEAARAGESGKGFSVVASEVRGLAQRASESANEIKDLVLGSAAQVEDGQRLVEQTGEMLTQIVGNVTSVSGMVAGIAAQAREQANGVQEINLGVRELDGVTQQNATMVGETSMASQQLTVEATRLSDLLTRFTGVAPAVEVGTSHDGRPELFSAPTAGGEDGREDTLEHERLVHGSWAAEMATPEPVPLKTPVSSPPEPAPRRAPPRRAVPAAVSSPALSDDVWDEF